MAYAESYKDEEDQQQQPGMAQKLGAESAVITGNEMKSGGQGSGSGQYTNLQSYLNQPGNQEFGQQFTNKIAEGVTGAEQQQQQVGEQFRNAANAGSVAKNDALIQEAGQSPESVVNDQNKYNEFIGMRDAQYKGPAQFSGTDEYYSPVQRATNEAKQRAEQATTESGKVALLGDLYGRPGYTGGQKKLDEVLLGMNPGTQQALLAQNERAGQVANNFRTLESSLNDYAKQKKGETEVTSAAAYGSVNPAYQNYSQGLQTKTQQTIAARDAEVAKINAAIKSRDISGLTPQELQSVGINPSQSMYGYTGDVAQSNNLMNINSLTTPEEYAKLNAYMSLANQTGGPISDASLLGTQTGKASYTKNAAVNDYLSNAEKAYQQRAGGQFFSLGNDEFINAPGGREELGTYDIMQSGIDDAINQMHAPEDYKQALRDKINAKRAEIRGNENDYFKGYGPLQNAMDIKRFRT